MPRTKAQNKPRTLDEVIADFQQHKADADRTNLTRQNEWFLRSVRMSEHEHASPEHTIERKAIDMLSERYPLLVQYALWYVYGLGPRPRQEHYAALAAFRASATAQEWYAFTHDMGTDDEGNKVEAVYTPVPIARSVQLAFERREATKARNLLLPYAEHDTDVIELLGNVDSFHTK